MSCYPRPTTISFERQGRDLPRHARSKYRRAVNEPPAAPLPPEFTRPRGGDEKQDCEIKAAKRRLKRVGPAAEGFRPVYLGDDPYCCEAVLEAGGSFLFTCKPKSHAALYECIQEVEVDSLRRQRQGPEKGPLLLPVDERRADQGRRGRPEGQLVRDHRRLAVRRAAIPQRVRHRSRRRQ